MLGIAVTLAAEMCRSRCVHGDHRRYGHPVEGPVVGAIAYFLLDKYFAQSGVWYLIVVGAAAIVVSLYLPRGLWGTLAHRTGFAVFPVRHTVRL